jgi:hypothetical protein
MIRIEPHNFNRIDVLAAVFSSAAAVEILRQRKEGVSIKLKRAKLPKNSTPHKTVHLRKQTVHRLKQLDS